MKKINKLLICFFLCMSAVSCSNLLNNDNNSSTSNISTNESSESKKTYSLKGTLSISGAVPDVLKMEESVSSSRSAIPYISGTDWNNYYWQIDATYNGETKSINSKTNSERFTTSTNPSFVEFIFENLEEGSWNFTAELKKLASVSASPATTDASIMKDTYSDAVIGGMTPIISHTFLLKPKTSETGKGSIKLPMTIDSSVKQITVTSTTTGWTNTTLQPTTTSSTLELSNVPSKTYEVTLNFYNATGTNAILLYTTVQTINVFDNMETNTWLNDGTSVFTGTTSATFNLTNTIISQFAKTTFYVGVPSGLTGITASDSTGTGSPYAPLESVTKAAQIIASTGVSTNDYRIFVCGEITGAQEVKNITSEMANSITITGYSGNTNNRLKGGSSGSVLYLDTEVSVTIKNLTITGGKGTEVSSILYGGGIYINKGCVELTTGVVVDENTANVGGGVYLVDGTLYLNDSAVVGKPLSALGANPTCAGTTSGTYANMATQSGGGIGVYEGTLWLGYRPPAQNETEAQEVSNTTGGVIYNLVAVADAVETHGGGIDNNHGTLNIAHGYVSYNYAFVAPDYNKVGCGGGITTAADMNLLGDATISHNESAYGGGVYISKGRDGKHGYLTMSGGSIESNASKIQNGDGDGGGVAIGANGSFKMSGGTIKLNTAAEYGGAIYHNGSLCEITGDSATIPKGNGTNNIHLNKNGQTITISGTTGHTGTGEIAVTAQVASRGLVVLTGDSTKVADNYSKFAATNPGMKLVNTGKLDLANIIKTINVKPGETVAANYFEPTGNTNADSTWNNSTIALNASSTQSKPFKYLSTALKFITYQNSNEDYVIVIDGMLTGHQEIQNNSDTNNPITLTKGTNIKSLTIKGKTGSSTDGFNGNNANTGTLYTKTDVPLTFEKLVIKGGASTGAYASGLQIENLDDTHKADVTISTGVEISGNTYAGSGSCPGGIRNNGILKFAAGIIKGNTGLYGGAIYNSGTMYMYGSAIIGDTSKTLPADSSNKSNKAGYGGGIYNGGDLYVGYKPPVSTAPTVPVPDDDFSGGIYYNYATYKGGAIGSNSSSRIFIYKGTIKCNSSPEGGGIQVYGYASNSKCELSVAGGTFTNNSASTAGGAINVEEYGVFNCEGATSIESTGQKNNDVYLGKGTFYAKVNITNEMTGTVALTPSSYSTTPVYLSEGSTGLMKANFTHFRVNDNNTSDTTSWAIKYDGKLSSGTSASATTSALLNLTGEVSASYTIAGYVTQEELTALKTNLKALNSQNPRPSVTLDLSGCVFPEGLAPSQFFECWSLYEVILPEGLEDLPNNAFGWCANLQRAVLPSTLKTIGTRTFNYDGYDGGRTTTIIELRDGCEAFVQKNGAIYTKDEKELVLFTDKTAESFTVPASVEILRECAFSSSPKLKTLNFASNSKINTIYWGCFTYCKSLESVTLPEKEIYLSQSLFTNCTSLVTFTFPEGITTIPYATFWSDSNLTTVTIPKSVIEIGSSAFEYCSSFTTINYRGSEQDKAAMSIGNSEAGGHVLNPTWNYNYTGN